MLDYHTFPTRAAAEFTADQLNLSKYEAVQLYLPQDLNTDENGHAWVIQIDYGWFLRNDIKFLRTDGTIR